MTNYNNFQTLLQDLKEDIAIVDGIIQKNDKKYVISRKVNGNWEDITLSQYKSSEDLILVDTNDFAFTVSRWDANFTISEQISQKTNK